MQAVEAALSEISQTLRDFPSTIPGLATLVSDLPRAVKTWNCVSAELRSVMCKVGIEQGGHISYFYNILVDSMSAHLDSKTTATILVDHCKALKEKAELCEYAREELPILAEHIIQIVDELGLSSELEKFING
jgi:hypothetical protein